MGEYLSGIIEGFFGRSWSWSDRRMFIDFLVSQSFNAYVYAPKSDTYLRRRWSEPWPHQTFEELAKLADYARRQRVQWGVGLSPFEAYVDYGTETLTLLETKLAEIDQLKPDILCILFDDMRGDVPGLAAVQARMVEDIAARTQAGRIIMCPTYYSEDPMLERFFGTMPAHYWQTLGSLLDKRIDFFWTGNKVCSTSYSADSVAMISEAMARPPVLWDNYPVNDGEKMCRRLHLQPFRNRPVDRPNWLRGHLVNPMNQAHLSRLVMATLPLEGEAGREFSEAAKNYCSGSLVELLERDLALFSGAGLDGINSSQIVDLTQEYSAFNEPCAHEVVGWLQGQYAFDPACLTDA